MSKERELLKKILNTGWLNHELSCEAEELLDQPEQEREPLSAETIAKLWGESYSGTTQMVRNFARAIEKAHGIGGGE
jgi:hypothetical protein